MAGIKSSIKNIFQVIVHLHDLQIAALTERRWLNLSHTIRKLYAVYPAVFKSALVYGFSAFSYLYAAYLLRRA